ncbi:hypothetical protein HK104_001258 [Borealophlyctis nickersoniae]|nr:hypothetical protein HK104_001258 [Borealophlyctis nickersoniae]
MTSQKSKQRYDPIVSTSSDTVINIPPTTAPKSHTAITPPTSPRKPDVDKPVAFKHRTREDYRMAVSEFKFNMVPHYVMLIPSVYVWIGSTMKFNEREGWAMFLAIGQMVVFPVWCSFIYFAFRAVMGNQVDSDIIVTRMWALFTLCLTLQGALAFVDPKDTSSITQEIMGVINLTFALAGWGWGCWEAAVWIHYKLWHETEEKVERALPGYVEYHMNRMP